MKTRSCPQLQYEEMSVQYFHIVPASFSCWDFFPDLQIFTKVYEKLSIFHFDLIVMATLHLRLALSALLAVLVHAATPASTGRPECRDDCIPASCVSDWWRATNAVRLSAAAVLVFFATFLPRVLVRLLIFVLTKLPFIRQCVWLCMDVLAACGKRGSD